jgi:hypothetical protein
MPEAGWGCGCGRDWSGGVSGRGSEKDCEGNAGEDRTDGHECASSSMPDDLGSSGRGGVAVAIIPAVSIILSMSKPSRRMR